MAIRRAVALSALTLFALTLMGSPVASAQEAASSFKIGVVDLKKVVDDYDKSIDLKARLEREAETKKKQIEGKEAALAKAMEDYRANRATMTDDQRYAAEEKLSSDRAEFEAEYKKLQSELNRTRDREVDAIFREVEVAIGEIGAAENYHLILEAGKSTTSGVLYFATPMDLTTRVTERLNAAYKK